MTPGEIVSRFCLGESVEEIAHAILQAEGDSPIAYAERHPAAWDAVEKALRDDMRWQQELEGLATQLPHNLAVAMQQQVADHCAAVDVSDWHRGYRAGVAAGLQQTVDAVGHLGNALVARANGVTREPKEGT